MGKLININTPVELRREYNEKILAELSKFLAENPKIRFCQALAILDINIHDHNAPFMMLDNFHEEPRDTYERMQRYLSRHGEHEEV